MGNTICERSHFREPDIRGPVEFEKTPAPDPADEFTKLSPIEIFELSLPFH